MVTIEIHFFVFQGRADGNKCALWLRLHLQTHLYSLGCFLQLHCGKVLFLGLLLLSLCCVGLKTAHIETNVEELWVEGESFSSSLLFKFFFFIIFFFICSFSPDPPIPLTSPAKSNTSPLFTYCSFCHVFLAPAILDPDLVDRRGRQG